MNTLNPANIAEREAARTVKSQASFQKFMELPATKLMASLIPASEPPEALQTLLKGAFDAGCNHGSGEILTEMIGAMLSGKGDRSEPRF